LDGLEEDGCINLKEEKCSRRTEVSFTVSESSMMRNKAETESSNRKAATEKQKQKAATEKQQQKERSTTTINRNFTCLRTEVVWTLT
jgi:hypothetical protein